MLNVILTNNRFQKNDTSIYSLEIRSEFYLEFFVSHIHQGNVVGEFFSFKLHIEKDTWKID